MPDNSPIRIAVLGDSIPWGQGLLPENKYAHLVAAALTVPGTPPPIVQMLAHSGAGIGAPHETSPAAHPEVPIPTPSIRAQAQSVPDPHLVDLVLVNGGMNDVDLRRILDPFVTSAELAVLIEAACFRSMRDLLQDIADRFTHPFLRVVVSGYYPILSPESDYASIDHLLRVHGIKLPVQLAQHLLFSEVVDGVMQFWHASHTATVRAIAELAPGFANHAPRRQLLFVPSPLRERNALFAPEPLVFGLAPDLDPQDQVAADRVRACSIFLSETFNPLLFAQCCLASVGHLTPAGARLTADSILAAIRASARSPQPVGH